MIKIENENENENEILLNVVFFKAKKIDNPILLIRGPLADMSGIDQSVPLTIKLGNGKIEIKNDLGYGNHKKCKNLEDEVSEVKRISSYDNGYKGYTVNLKLERNNDYEPVYISGPPDAYRFLSNLQYEANEKFLSLNLDSDNKCVGIYQAAQGTLKSAYVSPYDIFKAAMLTNSDRIILAHNHPSGKSTPSKEDINLTRKIYDAGKIMDIDILDHIVIGDGDYTSLKDKGYF